VLDDDLHYVASQRMLSSLVGKDDAQKIIENSWAHILDASKLYRDRSSVHWVFITNNSFIS